MPTITSERLAIGAVFIVLSGLALVSPMQSDSWWHLRAGQDAWHRVWPFVDRYSWTAAGRPWANFEWLGEVLFYAWFRAGGLPLLTFCCGALVVGAWALSWSLTAGPFEIRFVLFAGSLVTAAAGWAVRPVEFSYVCLIVTVWLIASDRWRWLPLLFVVWVNLHGGVLAGLVAIAGAFVGLTIAERRVPLALALTGAACALATMASPLGWHLVPEILASLGRSRANQLSEWLPPGLAAWLWPFWLLAVVLVVMTVVRGRRIDRLDRRTVVLCAIALALLPLALRAVRNVPSFLLVAVPAVTSVLTPVGWKPRHSATGERTGVNAMLLGAMGAIAAGLVAAAWWISIPPLHWRPISNDAVRAIGNCQGPMYNTYGQGGFLIWFVPGQPVFIDNRQDPYPDDLLAENLELEVSGNYRAAFAKHDVRCAIVPPHSKTALALASDGGWTRTFSDAEWAVFTRP